MLRRLGNYLKGRRSVKKEELDFSKVLDLLKSFGDTKGRIWAGTRYVSTDFDVSNAPLSDMVDYLNEQLKPVSYSSGLSYYTHVKHEVYSGDTSEKHYLELDHGKIKAKLCGKEIRGDPFSSASIDFLVEKE